MNLKLWPQKTETTLKCGLGKRLFLRTGSQLKVLEMPVVLFKPQLISSQADRSKQMGKTSKRGSSWLTHGTIMGFRPTI
ncbi:hypothetical protein MTR_3g466370 [Medicago truncatula]|uniref:Uncharacterized protein n=1 Tax=Medicago truncatula TaxID=3880 RepID=A0A072UYD9_MEDTR|nr:hypothetical protein MTR_3g466370 [Medicago truncatula]